MTPAPIPARMIRLSTPAGLERLAIRCGVSPPTLGMDASDGVSPVRCFWAFLRASLMRLMAL